MSWKYTRDGHIYYRDITKMDISTTEISYRWAYLSQRYPRYGYIYKVDILEMNISIMETFKENISTKAISQIRIHLP